MTSNLQPCVAGSISTMIERPILFSGEMVRAILAGAKTQTRRIVKPQPEWLPEVKTTRSAGGFLWPIGGLGQQCGAPITKMQYGVPGDRLWVKETWSAARGWDNEKPLRIPVGAAIRYVADGALTGDLGGEKLAAVQFGRVRPSIFMRRWMSRITLEVTDVRVERLQDISEADAIAEGVKPTYSTAYYNVLGKEGKNLQVVEGFVGGIPKPGDYWQGIHVEYVQRIESRQINTGRDSYKFLWESINGPGSWAANPWVWVVSFRRLA